MTVPVLAQVVLGHVSGLPEDAVVNDLCFLADDAGAAIDGIGDSIESFFNTDNTNVEIRQYLGGQLSRVANACSIRFYDLTGALDGSPHGSPFETRAWTLGARQGTYNLPDEVALVQTFWAAGWSSEPEQAVNPAPPPAKIRPQSRFRGRMYLGPLNGSTATTASDTSPRPSTSFLTDLTAAWFRFMDERPDFAVWSRADEVLRTVAGGDLDGRITVDNAFDTQRRRGVAPTARTLVWP